MPDEKSHPKKTPPPEWLEVPRVTRGVTIPTSSGLRSAIDKEKFEVDATIDHEAPTLQPGPGVESGPVRMLHAIDAPDVVGIDAPDVVGRVDPEITIKKDSSDSISIGIPNSPLMPAPEWLEIPQGATGPVITPEAPKAATGPVITPSPPTDVSAEPEGPPKCPHCGAILTKAQLELKATGTKALCSECFNMV